MLKEILFKDGQRDLVVTDCERLIDNQVAAKSGLSGMAVKAVYAVVKKIKPGFIRSAVNDLLDEFVDRLEPFYAAWQAKPQGPLESFMGSRAAKIADALLGVTDARAERSTNATLKKSYEKLRPTAARHVEAAVPELAALLAKHTSGHAAA